ncbi:uncharacterized protein LOC124539801 [Vanessa cardui]|uniref:uncharacterized protein LOC124539801 n=1 Tax=Vanessa cardui TaxID=171605 RepID=UPI001F144FA8|nr:uncharacterized protein LOC124539801 [Vanessa cardui]
MTEEHIGFLVNAASVIAPRKINDSYDKLRSYYLMRCKEMTRGYGLPKKQFSEKSRCSYCCLEWDSKSQTKIKPIKLSKRQRKRIRFNIKNKAPYKRESLLYSNEMENICSFCNKSVKIPILKPSKTKNKKEEQNDEIAEDPVKPKIKKVKLKIDEKLQSEVYCKSKIAFSLNKQKNTLPGTIKVQAKVIKNSKKKKDKFAGLCQTAVIAATKLKQEKEKENKLNLFLKPSL